MIPDLHEDFYPGVEAVALAEAAPVPRQADADESISLMSQIEGLKRSNSEKDQQIALLTRLLQAKSQEAQTLAERLDALSWGSSLPQSDPPPRPNASARQEEPEEQAGSEAQEQELPEEPAQNAPRKIWRPLSIEEARALEAAPKKPAPEPSYQAPQRAEPERQSLDYGEPDRRPPSKDEAPYQEPAPESSFGYHSYQEPARSSGYSSYQEPMRNSGAGEPVWYPPSKEDMPEAPYQEPAPERQNFGSSTPARQSAQREEPYASKRREPPVESVSPGYDWSQDSLSSREAMAIFEAWAARGDDSGYEGYQRQEAEPKPKAARQLPAEEESSEWVYYPKPKR